MEKKRFPIAPFLLLILLAPLLPANALSETEIKAILIDRIDRAEQSVGIVVGLIDTDGRTVVGYGRTGPGNEASPTGDTVFEIGSISKVFTGTLLADLATRGKVALEDPAQKYLPDTVQLGIAENGKPITLYDLATHTSGLPGMPDNFAPADSANPYADYSVEQLYAFLSAHEPTRATGVQAEYSNLGMGLLGHVLARRHETTYEWLVHDRITGPLKMDDTVIALTPELRERLAHGHDARLNPAPNWDIPTLAGAGALRSTVDDMLTFAAANLGLVPSKISGAMAHAREIRENFGAEGTDIGLAWITTRKHDRTITWHNGGTGGYHSFIGLDMERGLGVVVLSNATPSIDDIGFHLLDPKFKLADVEPVEPTTDIPATPVGVALKKWIEAVRSADAEAAKAHYESAFDESFKNAVAVDAYLGFREQLQGLLSSAEVSLVVARDDHDLSAYIENDGAWFAIHIQVIPDEPHLIFGLMVQPAAAPK